MDELNLFMVMLGCTPAGRHTEQHDIFFGIGKDIGDLVPAMKHFWKGSGPMHVDAWRKVKFADGFKISIVEKGSFSAGDEKLFFLNLGGYKKDVFDELHYKMITVAPDKGEAVRRAKETAFFKHTGFDKKAASHVDDKYGVDVDDLAEIKDILSAADRVKYDLKIERSDRVITDEINLGYFKLDSLITS